jgi:hypothetical protein
LSLPPWPVVDLAGAELRWSFGVGRSLFEPFCADGPLSGTAFFCAGEGPAWPVVLFSSGFCAPLWP